MPPKKDRRVDAYVARSADFARPILEHLRAVIHAACPDVEEAIKWGCPHFLYQGMFCSMAAFKGHCAFTLSKGALVLGEKTGKNEGMGHLGKITKISDLPSKKTLTKWLKMAMKLNERGVKAPRTKAAAKAPLAVPKELVAALKKNANAAANFAKLPPSHKREYVEWIGDAKREETRERRLALAVKQIAEGKSQNWKYER